MKFHNRTDINIYAKGCKNHRETLYSSKWKIVYVVGKPCNIYRHPVSCISKWRLLKIMFPNSCFYPSKWLRVQTITFARKIPLRLQVNWMGKIGYQDCKLPYCMATYRRPLVYAFFGFVKKWQDQASREILASFFITWTQKTQQRVIAFVTFLLFCKLK